MASQRMLKIYERDGRNTSSNDPKMMEARVFIGNLPADSVTRQAVEQMYKDYGKILGISLHKSYGFVQFDNTDSANEAVKATHGKMMNGKRLDVNIATERRKEPTSASRSGKEKERDRDTGRRRDRGGGGWREREHSRERHRGRFRSPSPSRMDFESRMYPWDRMGPPGSGFPRPPPPHLPPHGRDPYLDPFHDPFYIRPRDDPFDRYPERLPPRDYPPPRRDLYGPPLKRGSDPYDPYPRPLSPPDIRGRGPPPPPSASLERRAPVERVAEDGVLDMEVIVVNRPQRDYGEIVKNRMEAVGVRVEIATLSPTVSLADALDSAAQRGLLYCVIITSQHEIHRSVTLTILHGRNPQEHKNMPLDDALGLIDRDFERYCQGVREGRIPPRKPLRDSKGNVSSLLSKAASGEELNPGQLQSLIDMLQEKKQNTAAPRPTDFEFNSRQVAKDDIQRQQADLQAKILSLLGSNAVVPSPSGPNSSSSPVPKGLPSGGSAGSGIHGAGGPAGYPSGMYGSYGVTRGGAEGGAGGRGYGGYSGYGY